jgi:glycosyltransferase involved in cell wall biosynthesis
MNRRLFVVTELYYPEETSTGFILTHLAEGLSGPYEVTVLCSQPTYKERGIQAPWRETRHGVRIHRMRSTRFQKDNLIGRCINALTSASSMFLACVAGLRRGDGVLVVTNPPILPYLVVFAAWCRRARVILLVHDVYPQVLAAAGFLTPDSLLYRVLVRTSAWLYRHVDRIVCLGRDMERRIRETAGARTLPLERISNWGSHETIHPVGDLATRFSPGHPPRFVVGYCGNLGRTHSIDTVVDAMADLSRRTPDVVLRIVGWGAARGYVEEQIRKGRVPQIELGPAVRREEVHAFLAGCDVMLITLKAGMSGLSVPSRLYDFMAAGKPIIAAVDEDSEVAAVIREEGIGWVVPPSQAGSLATAILDAKEVGAGLSAYGARARHAVLQHYTLAHVLSAYRGMLDHLFSSEPGDHP